jgi:glycosyltransferase involved in cell wall biosynthesis
MRAIISAYAVRPYSGSEPGLGWQWVRGLAPMLDKVLVITESEFANEIKDWLEKEKIKNIEFVFIPIGTLGRKLCWNQGNYLFYFFYRLWQIRVYIYLLKQNLDDYDYIHHLNMIGYREPGLLHLLKKPFVLGPLGGLNTVPQGFMLGSSLSERLKFKIKKSFNFISLRLPYVQMALRNSRLVISANSESYYKLSEIGVDSALINETGLEIKPIGDESRRKKNRILWVGKMVQRKLPLLALDVFVDLLKYDNELTMTFVGDGPQLQMLKDRITEYGIDSRVEVKGRVERHTVLELMESSLCLLFTSIDEGTPHVVLEAISSGLHVFTHDSCGMRDVIEAPSLKVLPVDYETSRKEFTEKIVKFIDNRESVELPDIQRLSWQSKFEEFVQLVKSKL